MKKILTSLSIIGLVAVMAISATVAYFNDTETSTGNTFTAGGIDLKIDLQCPGGGCNFALRDLHGAPFFFNPLEYDIKPGDKGEVTISWHVDDNDAWGRIRLADIYDYERGCTEPEENDPVIPDLTCDIDPNGIYGELSEYLIFNIWMDEGESIGWQCPENSNGPCTADELEGNNILDGDEKMLATITARDLVAGVELPEILDPDLTYYVGFEWELPFETPNIVQTDALNASIVMEVVQSRNNPTPWTP